MIVSHEHRFIFLKTHKTAGTSIEVLLSGLIEPEAVVTPVLPAAPGHEPRNYEGRFDLLRELRDVRTPRSSYREWRAGRRFYNHIAADRIRARLGPRVWDSYFKFCFERNPWDKTVSAYFYELRRRDEPLPFAEFVMTHPLPSDFDRYSIGGAPAMDFIGRYEHLHDDLRTILRGIGLPMAELPREKGSFRPRESSAPEMFDDVLDRHVAAVFRREIECLEYPASCFEAAGPDHTPPAS
jgi:hypothetical protein